MTPDLISKLRDALNLIAQIPVDKTYDQGQREQAFHLIKQVIDESKNPFTVHWKEQA